MQNKDFGYSTRHKIGASFDTSPHPGNGRITSQDFLPITAIATCPSCGSTRVNLIAMPQHCPHHAARRCGGCDRFFGWEPKPSNQQKRQKWQGTISQLLEFPGLSPWERNFLSGLKGKKISPRQQEILERIENKTGIRG